MADLKAHFEPYLYLAEVTDRSALIAWGGFFFWISSEHPVEGQDWMLIDDDDLDQIYPPREDTIGASSKPYDKSAQGARVEIRDANTGNVVDEKRAPGMNHCWVSGLEPDTVYTYKVFVNDKEWASGELRDWVSEDGYRGLRKSTRSYDNRFCTRPSVEHATDVVFAVLGDFGRGVHEETSDESRQREVARALERAVNREGVRLLLTTGDNIYKHKAGDAGGSGKEDDDWFFSFYQPYRYIINRIPVYPSCGNHDSGETLFEPSDDRKQLNDNFYIVQRFTGLQGLASIDPGLFYRVRYGSNIEFISLDTSKNSVLPWVDRNFEHPNHEAFLKAAFPITSGSNGVWRIPFGHHPPYCAGPKYDNFNDVKEKLVERYCVPSDVRVLFSGHEHNFQHSQDHGIDFIISGGGGDIRTDPIKPEWVSAARTAAWGKGGHFLIVKINGNEMRVWPVAELQNDQLEDLPIFTPAGTQVATPIVISS